LVFDKSIALAAGANIYLKYSEVNNTVKNLTEAKRTVESALTYFKKENYPYQYAILMNSMGTIYQKLAEKENRIDNLKKSIEAYKEAMRFFQLKNMDYILQKRSTIWVTFI